MSNPTALVQKLWNYCNILREDGLSYSENAAQLTFLPFLKMADEQSRPPFNKPSPIPKGKDWPALLRADGDELEIQYRHALEELGKRSGKRDKVNLDLFWLKDDALEESANQPAPGITDDLEVAVEQFATIAEDMK